MAHGDEYVDPAVEKALKVVRRVRDDIALLLELAEKAEERGCGAEADRILDTFFDERIGYEEALEKLKRLTNC